MKKYSILLMAIFATLFFASCEGPMGPPGLDGEDGLDGADGEVKCLVCHAGDVINGISSQFAQSTHVGAIVAGSREWIGTYASCTYCHTSEGFIHFATTGSKTLDVPVAGDWTCKTCHGVHETFEAADYALRANSPAAFIIDANTSPDFGNSNLCKNCHQSRSAAPTTDIVNLMSRTHPHYGPQSNILYGFGFAEFAGTYTYPAKGNNTHWNANARCVECHMSDYGNAKGGHTFKPGVDGCNSCHAGPDLTTTYDYKNVQTNVKALLDQLRDALVAKGVLNGTTYEVIPNANCPKILAQGFFNWYGLKSDGSYGVHNPEYTEALLNNTIAAINAYTPGK
jgi:hypothetical protein